MDQLNATSSERNWAGNYTYEARRLHRPTSVEHVQEIVAKAEKVRVLGSRHSFNGIADSVELLSLSAIPPQIGVDRQASTVSFAAGLTYGSLAEALMTDGLALHNLASLPHISVAGAVATGTHGSGDANGNLATAVASLELVTSSGEIVSASRGEPGFDGMVVGLGALGAVTRLTLDVEPAYEARQRVFEGLEWKMLFDHFNEITSSGYSVSIFTRWGRLIDQVWVKTRVTDAPESVRSELFGAVASTLDRHPILGVDPINCSPQLGRPGPWSERLPHFRMGFTPSIGDELQSEYLLPRQHAVPAIEAVRALAEKIRPVLQVCEIRTMTADQLWMSPAYGRDTVGMHFTWQPDQQRVESILVELEAALAPFHARPHWGKLFAARADAIASLYERLPDFSRLADRLDPRGAFRNTWFEACVVGAASVREIEGGLFTPPAEAVRYD
jgi:xylitol oxidase